jgi:hypothetical protein
MSGRYVDITKQEFDEFMEHLGFECTNPNSSFEEYVYSYSWHDNIYECKIYSSISPQKGGSKKRGADAIRLIVLIHTEDGTQCVHKASRVYRIGTWRQNLAKRIDAALDIGSHDQFRLCKKCGSPMVGREGRYGFFYGCSAYPTCNYIWR